MGSPLGDMAHSLCRRRHGGPRARECADGTMGSPRRDPGVRMARSGVLPQQRSAPARSDDVPQAALASNNPERKPGGPITPNLLVNLRSPMSDRKVLARRLSMSARGHTRCGRPVPLRCKSWKSRSRIVSRLLRSVLYDSGSCPEHPPSTSGPVKLVRRFTGEFQTSCLLACRLPQALVQLVELVSAPQTYELAGPFAMTWPGGEGRCRNGGRRSPGLCAGPPRRA